MIPERTEQSKAELHEFCKYLSELHDLKKMKMVEIGSWTGCSAVIFAEYFKTVYCIDTWRFKNLEPELRKHNIHKVEEIFDQRTAGLNIVKIKGDSVEVLTEFTRKFFDFCYIDAGHEYDQVKADIEICKKKCKYITGHDYYWKFPGIMKAVNEEFGKPLKIFKDTSWIGRI
jgi:predicted O-methyltransferase YrrM